jgi:DNA polymerase-3 subunit epsilon
MKLTRPICFFDIESTGLDLVQDRIVSLAIVKVLADGFRTEFYELFNPGFTMSPEVIAIHGISNEMVADKPRFAARAHAVAEFIRGCDLAGFNLLNFDLPLLAEEMTRAMELLDLDGVHVIDAGNIFKKKEPRTLTAAKLFYCGETMEGAHNALFDTLATVDVLRGQLARYTDLAALDVPALAQFSKMDQRVDLAGKLVRDAEGDVVYNFGKCKGTKMKHDPSFGEWMLRQTFLTHDTRGHTRTALRAIYDAERKAIEEDQLT